MQRSETIGGGSLSYEAEREHYFLLGIRSQFNELTRKLLSVVITAIAENRTEYCRGPNHERNK